MVIRIFGPSATFSGIEYNNNKVESSAAELMAACNFGSLDGLTNVRPQDYQHYLLAITAQNTRIKNIQFHAAISTEGRLHNKRELTAIATRWLKAMGYEGQPYLVYFHNDTPNNHIHIITSRVDKNGRKIRDSYEHARSVVTMKRVMTEWLLDKIASVLVYCFTTEAQFKQLLERHGFDPQQELKDLPSEKIKYREPGQERKAQLKELFRKYPSAEILKEQFNIDLVFHAKAGMPPYGYTIFDDAEKNVFKGGQIMPLKEFLSLSNPTARSNTGTIASPSSQPHYSATKRPGEVATALQINISKDIDDEAIHGPRRHRNKKAHNKQR